MGKKDKFIRPGEEEEEYNAEADEEYAAVMAMRREQEQNSAASPEHENKSNYNRQALTQSLENMPSSKLPFKESFQLCEYELPTTEENDDLAREMAFFEHSLQAVKSGRKKLSSLGIPHIRPKDYFCEHIKSDEHMGRIKDRLILEEKKIEAFEKRKQRDFDRKFAKKVTIAKKEKRKDPADKIAKKSTSPNDKAGNVSGSKRRYEDFQKDSSGDNSQEQRSPGNAYPKKSLKRRNMDKKYGFGGKDRKRAKLNDAKSLNDLADFHPRGGKQVRRPSSKAKFSGNTGNSAGRNNSSRGKKSGNRPGKEARMKSRKARTSA